MTDCALGGRFDATSPASVDADGVYSSNLNLPTEGEWTVVAFAQVRAKPFTSKTVVGVHVDPAPARYVDGPFGNRKGDTMTDLGWDGFMDSDADEDDDPFNEPPRKIQMQNFFQGPRGDMDAKVIMINLSAGWCGPCQQEAQVLSTMVPQYRDRGARFLTLMMEDAQGNPPPVDYAKQWGEQFSLVHATGVDPTSSTWVYRTDDAVPMNILVRASDMVILDVWHGFDQAHLTGLLDANL